jgi:hypothetical protein
MEISMDSHGYSWVSITFTQRGSVMLKYNTCHPKLFFGTNVILTPGVRRREVPRRP